MLTLEHFCCIFFIFHCEQLTITLVLTLLRSANLENKLREHALSKGHKIAFLDPYEMCLIELVVV